MVNVSAPGRICLFGEHQDYLGLPVIAAAISRRIYLTGQQRADKQIILNLPDIASKESFELAPKIEYQKDRDYLRSTLNVLQRRGFTFSQGLEVTVRGNIPINSGTSSSSALIVAWIKFLIQLTDNPKQLSAKEIGELANAAEVLEFGEPGGIMDHYSSAIGHIIYLESDPVVKVGKLKPHLGTFVLGDSQEPKDTITILKHVKFGMLQAIQKIKTHHPAFNLQQVTAAEADSFRSLLTPDEFSLFQSNISDRDIVRQAKKMFLQDQVDSKLFGQLLNQHQNNLRDAKRISTPKINAMINAALEAGALGAKINGSGGGGCMFAYGPENPEIVAEAIERQGGKAYIITVDEGVRTETGPETIKA
nr:galactokinase family protein [Adhaeribacter aquaticus]